MKFTGITRGALLLGTLLLAAKPMSAEDLLSAVRQCGVQPNSLYSRMYGETGGIHITAKGTLRVLIVFASFPDDTTPHSYWPVHNPPLYMNQFIDSDTTVKSQGPFNLTNYFDQMSMGQFHLVGDVIWIESVHSQEEYRNGSYGRANLNALQERVDPLVDFSSYDQWTKEADYQHANVPDGQVDMIVMVWRTNMFEYLGEASLGYKPGFVADGKRIEMGFPESIEFPRGSGITCEYVYTDDPYRVMQTMVHELSHWQLGGLHPYNSTSLHGKHAYWGMMCSGLRVASCANSYERERLGWISVPEIQVDVNIPVSDYLRTGIAYKYRPVGGEPFEYFYIENHQKVSEFDDVTANPEDKGIWILHQEGPYMELDNLKIRPSDGNWYWDNPGTTSSCFSQELPVFKRGAPGVRTGESHRDQIPTYSSDVNWMYVYKDPAGKLNCGAFFKGGMFEGAFNVKTSSVFSPYSNPGSNTWSNLSTTFTLEVISEVNGVVTVRSTSDPTDAAPVRRYLSSDPTEHGIPPGSIALAWGAQWTDGQPVEADVNWSELERQIGNEEMWTTLYQGQATSWKDASVWYDTSGTVPVLFRVRVRDTQGKYSTWSNVFQSAMLPASGVEDQADRGNDLPVHFELKANYPNPFNPTTLVRYQLPVASEVKLVVYDLLGQELGTLVSGERSAGTYETTWDASAQASGIYLCRLDAVSTDGRSSYHRVRKMLLLK